MIFWPPPGSYPTGYAFQRLIRPRLWRIWAFDAPQTPFRAGYNPIFSNFRPFETRSRVKNALFWPPPGSHPTGYAFQRLIRPRLWRLWAFDAPQTPFRGVYNPISSDFRPFETWSRVFNDLLGPAPGSDPAPNPKIWVGDIPLVILGGEPSPWVA